MCWFLFFSRLVFFFPADGRAAGLHFIHTSSQRMTLQGQGPSPTPGLSLLFALSRLPDLPNSIFFLTLSEKKTQKKTNVGFQKNVKETAARHRARAARKKGFLDFAASRRSWPSLRELREFLIGRANLHRSQHKIHIHNIFHFFFSSNNSIFELGNDILNGRVRRAFSSIPWR